MAEHFEIPEALKKKVGPLPVYVWATGVGLLGLLAWRHFHPSANTGGSTGSIATQAAPSAGGSGGGSDSGSLDLGGGAGETLPGGGGGGVFDVGAGDGNGSDGGLGDDGDFTDPFVPSAPGDFSVAPVSETPAPTPATLDAPPAPEISAEPVPAPIDLPGIETRGALDAGQAIAGGASNYVDASGALDAGQAIAGGASNYVDASAGAIAAGESIAAGAYDPGPVIPDYGPPITVAQTEDYLSGSAGRGSESIPAGAGAGALAAGEAIAAGAAKRYYTYKRDVPAGSTVHFTAGKGYYAA